MHKLLPFRQYDEKDVFNLFSLDLTANASLPLLVPKGLDTGNLNAANWSGTGVGIGAANAGLGGDEPNSTGTSKAYLGAIGAGDQGFALTEGAIYPNAGGKVLATALADDTDFFGITLRATLAYDENGEKLLYYQEKLDELQCVLPEQPVPVATRGFFTLTVGTAASGAAIDAATAGEGITTAADGQFTAANAALGDVGFILATGTNGGNTVAMVQISPR
jgi:hypothetical protein